MALKQNIIYVYFKGKHLVTSKSQYQYNHGQCLYFADLDLPQAFEVHFSNTEKGYSKTQIGSNKLVEIPDEYYWSGATMIYAWVYLHSDIDDGETEYGVRIPLAKRSKPTDEEPLPQQESTMERAIAELNNAVEITTENVNKTGEDRTEVSNIRDEVVDLKEDIDTTSEAVAQNAQEAINASQRSEASAQNAAEFEEGARNYSNEAKGYAQSALESKNTAKQKADIATNASTEAMGYRDEALEIKRDIVDYRDETLTAKNNAESFANNAAQSASNAKNDADFLRNANATATTLPEGSNATATLNDGLFEFGIPKGDAGDKGDTGNSGVYIGADEPADEDVGVWVDTDGTMDTIGGFKVFYLGNILPSGKISIIDGDKLHEALIQGIPTVIVNPSTCVTYFYTGQYFEYMPYHVWTSAPFADFGYEFPSTVSEMTVESIVTYDFEYAYLQQTTLLTKTN